MLVLFETPAGYAIFKLLDDKKLSQSDNLYLDFESPEAASKIVKLKHFEKFADTTEALAATTAAVEGKLCKSLKKTLKKHCSEVQEQLAVADAKLGNAIKDKLSLSCVSNTGVQELMRCIRSQMDSLLIGLTKKDISSMSLGLAHSLSRYKLKFSPDKIDTMIVQAVNLLDDLDKELNNYVMRCREWYGWHFPELGSKIPDNISFIKTVHHMGTRENASKTDMSDFLPENIEEEVKKAAETSMGTEISEEDIMNIQELCVQILEISQYRGQLYDYLKARMLAMAPNLTIIVGDLVGARLISHAGSLINLSKMPASTVQILGAEKALFRALKTKKDTPKYGIIYHAPTVAQASTKIKGKSARMVSTKAALAVRIDALGEDSNTEFSIENKAKLESRLRLLEEGNVRRLSGTGKAKAKFEKYHSKSEYMQYPVSADVTIKRKSEEEDDKKPLIEVIASVEASQEEQVPKKKKKTEEETLDESVAVKQEPEEDSTEPKKKKKKKKQQVEQVQNVAVKAEKVEAEAQVEDAGEVKKKKKKRKKQESEEAAGKKINEVEDASSSVVEKKKKKKKKD